MKKALKGFYFITDAALSRKGNAADVAAAVAVGACAVQYRAKDRDARELINEALRLKKICRGKTLFLINDRVDVALAVNADGVHLGQKDLPCALTRKILGPQRIIGVSATNVREALRAKREGADYLGVGPIFPTGTKKDAEPPCGVKMIRKIKRVCGLPIVALGGIGLKNAQEVIEAGADSVAAIAAVVRSSDVKARIRQFNRLFRVRRRGNML